MTVPTLSFTAPEGPKGAPLLVLGPSLGTSTILWETTLPTLRERYRVTAWDLPGHGESAPATAPFSLGEIADAVADGARALGADDIRYAGISIGGAVGLELALRHPDLVRAAAIIDSGARIGTAESWQERAAQVRAQSTSILIVGSGQRWFAPGSIERVPDLAGRLFHVLQDADDESYALCCEALAAYDVRDRLGEIRMPVLAVWGEYDQVTPEAYAQEIADAVADGRTARIADAAHLPAAEQPDALAAELVGFFEAAQ